MRVESTAAPVHISACMAYCLFNYSWLASFDGFLPQIGTHSYRPSQDEPMSASVCTRMKKDPGTAFGPRKASKHDGSYGILHTQPGLECYLIIFASYGLGYPKVKQYRYITPLPN